MRCSECKNELDKSAFGWDKGKSTMPICNGCWAFKVEREVKPALLNMKPFPKYTRQENKGCKLSDEQIVAARERRKQGETLKAIGKDFGVTEQAIYYWCLSDEEKEAKNKAHYQAKKEYQKEYNLSRKDYHKEYRKRKMELHPEYKEYENQFTIEHRIKNTNYLAYKPLNDKLYRERHLEEIKKRQKEYQLKNLDKFRAYNKKSREKKKAEKLSTW